MTRSLQPVEKHQDGINMVDLMMWIVIASLLLATAIQGIGYYQKTANIHTLKSDLTGASQNVMAAAALDKGVVVKTVLDDALEETKSSAEVQISAEESTNGGLPFLRATHPAVSDVDGIYLFEACGSLPIGVNIVPKEGNPLTENCGIGVSPGSEPEPIGPDKDGDGIGDATDPDLDGDGVPNEEDRDADGDGVQDGYVAGGPITALDGTAYATSGTQYGTRVINGGTQLTSNVVTASASTNRIVKMHFLVTCVKPNGAFYKVSLLNGITAPTTSTNTNYTTTPCGTDRIDEYTVKPVTKEAVASGTISNGATMGSYTFVHNNAAGGYRWSEPDGYPAVGTFQSAYLGNGGKTVYASYRNTYGTQYTMTGQYVLTCERPDKSSYKVNRLASWRNSYNTIETRTIPLEGCGTDLITAYDIFPVNKLGDAQNKENFSEGYTMSGSKSWKESDGYRTTGSFQYSHLGNGGSTVYASFRNDTGTQLAMTTQYILVCERPDKTTYNVNRMLTWTNSFNTIETRELSLTGCGTDLITAYDIFPVNNLSAAQNKEVFGGWAMAGSKSWKESVNGYRTTGSFQSAYVDTAGTTLYATYRNSTGTQLTMTTQYSLKCKRSDATTYNVNRLATWTNGYNTIESRTLALTGCGTDKISAYDIYPVNNLSAAANRTIFSGWAMAGSKSWSE